VARPYVYTIRAVCRAKSTCGSYPLVAVLLAHGDLTLRTMCVCVQVVVTHVVLRSPAATAPSGGPGPAPAAVPPSMGKTPSSRHRTPFARMGSNRVVPLGTLGPPYTSFMHTLMVANGLVCVVRCLHGLHGNICVHKRTSTRLLKHYQEPRRYVVHSSMLWTPRCPRCLLPMYQAPRILGAPGAGPGLGRQRRGVERTPSWSGSRPCGTQWRVSHPSQVSCRQTPCPLYAM
jgi:hypothetical protein